MKINYFKIVLFSVFILRNGIQKAHLLMNWTEFRHLTTKHVSEHGVPNRYHRTYFPIA